MHTMYPNAKRLQSDARSSMSSATMPGLHSDRSRAEQTLRLWQVQGSPPFGNACRYRNSVMRQQECDLFWTNGDRNRHDGCSGVSCTRSNWECEATKTAMWMSKSISQEGGVSYNDSWTIVGCFGLYYAGWWFGTFFIFPYNGNNDPNWLIFFRGVETTNQYVIPTGFRKSLVFLSMHLDDMGWPSGIIIPWGVTSIFVTCFSEWSSLNCCFNNFALLLTSYVIYNNEHSHSQTNSQTHEINCHTHEIRHFWIFLDG